jgi:hypothetical protein
MWGARHVGLGAWRLWVRDSRARGSGLSDRARFGVVMLRDVANRYCYASEDFDICLYVGSYGTRWSMPTRTERVYQRSTVAIL